MHTMVYLNLIYVQNFGLESLFIYIILKCVNLYSELLRGSSQRRQYTSFEKIPAEL